MIAVSVRRFRNLGWSRLSRPLGHYDSTSGTLWKEQNFHDAALRKAANLSANCVESWKQGGPPTTVLHVIVVEISSTTRAKHVKSVARFAFKFRETQNCQFEEGFVIVAAGKFTFCGRSCVRGPMVAPVIKRGAFVRSAADAVYAISDCCMTATHTVYSNCCALLSNNDAVEQRSEKTLAVLSTTRVIFFLARAVPL